MRYCLISGMAIAGKLEETGSLLVLTFECNSTSSLVNVATKSPEIWRARSKQAVQRSFSSRSVVNDLLTRKSKENTSDTDLLDDQEEDLLPEDTQQNQLMSLLAKMNENMATMSDSLRKLHDKWRHVVSADQATTWQNLPIRPQRWQRMTQLTPFVSC